MQIDAVIEKPIFIVGVGRSGSTIFHHIFARHPRVAWLSGLCDRYPDKPSINRWLMQALDYPILGAFLRGRNPAECFRFWEYYAKGFRRPCRDLLPGDVTNRTKKRVRGAMVKILTEKRNRLLIKITGWPRIGYLREIFDGAKFIHIRRDARAVVNSMLNVDWWWGWRGPQNWRWGELTSNQREEWERHNRSFVALACIEWKMLIEAMEQAKHFVHEDNFFELTYEDLCSSPVVVFQDVIRFCELEWTEEFQQVFTKYTLRDQNYKWHGELTVEQQAIMQDVLHGYL